MAVATRNATRAVPPDGGWGWVVVIASFVVHIFTDGVTYSFGIFTNQFLTYFGESAAATSWISSILVGVTLCSGPFSSALVNRYGCRAVTIMGGVLATVSLFLSIWAPSIYVLYITAGFLTGLGLGLIYLPAIVCVTVYFEKKRSLATGIAVCGSGLGTFLLAPLIKWICTNYGWQTAMGTISVLMINCILFGLLFRPLEEEEIPDEEGEELKPITVKPVIVPPKIIIKSEKSEPNGRPISVHGHDELFLSQGGLTVRNGGMNGDIARMALSQPHLHTERRGSGVKHHHSGVMYRKDVLYSGSLAHINHVSNSSMISEAKSARYRTTSLPEETMTDEPEAPTKLCGIQCSQETADGFKRMVDLSLLKDPLFAIYAVSNFLTSIGFNVPYVHLDHMVQKYDIDGSHLIAAIGLSNTFGRIILGYIADMPWVNRLHIYNWSLTICGVATAICVVGSTYTSFLIYSIVYGFTIGAYVGLTSVILVDLLGLDKLTNAFGLLLLFQGIASLLGPPITGLLYDMTNSYTPGFILSGCLMALSGVMLFAVPALQRYVARKEEKKQLPSS